VRPGRYTKQREYEPSNQPASPADRELLVRCARQHDLHWALSTPKPASPRLAPSAPLRRQLETFPQAWSAAPRSTSSTAATGKLLVEDNWQRLTRRTSSTSTARCLEHTTKRISSDCTSRTTRLNEGGRQSLPVFPWGQTWESRSLRVQSLRRCRGYSVDATDKTWSRRNSRGSGKTQRRGWTTSEPVTMRRPTGRAWNAKVDFGGFSNSPPL